MNQEEETKIRFELSDEWTIDNGPLVFAITVVVIGLICAYIWG